MKTKIISILLLCSLTTLAQKQSDIVYTPVQNVLGEDAPEGQQPNEFFMGSDFSYAVFSFTNVIREGLSGKKEQQKLENARQQSLAKLNIIKGQYSSYDKYPEKIIDGWHNVMVTDNSNFCKDAKVFVKDNKIKKFVIDNYVPMNFTSTGSIKKAKNIITLKNYNKEQLSVLEVYFIYDIEEQQIVDPPIDPGYICFWSDIKNYSDIQLKMDGVMMEKFTVRYNDAAPNCFDNGTVCRILKPGQYSFIANGRGTISWKGTFEVKSNMCCKYRLGR